MSAESVAPICPARKARRGPREHLRSALLALAQDKAEITHHTERAWASITFSGSRHSLRLIFEGNDAVEAGEHFIAALPDHEFTIGGQLVADATIASAEHALLPNPHLQVECELLLLLDG